MYRQGDLLFVLENIPCEATVQKDGVLALGEVTGHRHRISDSAKAVMFMAGAVAYVRAMHDADIVHEEHKTITLPPGEWKVIRQREYIPNGWVQVAD